jgi:hypothetical protein
VRRAAQMTWTPVSPGVSIDESSVVQAVFLGNRWTDQGVAVTFPDGAGGYRTEFDSTGPVTVRVTYLYRCPIPVVDRILCQPYENEDTGNDEMGQTAKAELNAFGAEQLVADQNPGRRFLALTAERTLPLQGQAK